MTRPRTDTSRSARQSPERQAGATEAQQALLQLAEGARQKYGASKDDVERLSRLSDQEAEALIRRSKGTRKISLRLARAEAMVRRGSTRTALRNGARSLAFAFFELYLAAHLDSSQRMAAAEASLRLAQGFQNPGPPWITALRNYYDNPNQDGITPSWEAALGTSETETRHLLSVVREQLRLPEFRPRQAIRRTSTLAAEVLDEELQIPLVNQPSNLRIDSLHTRDYRGIPGELSVDFLGSNGKASTCLILGDNGVGKSSIVSAIEFACQDRIGRLPLSVTSASPQAINLMSNSDVAEVEVRFNDGTSLTRRAVHSKGKITSAGTLIPKSFGLAPMSLQRADIIQFLNTPPAERGRLFIEHFAEGELSSPDASISSLRERLTSLKMQRRNLMAELAAVAQASVAPANQESFEKLMRNTYFSGLTRRQWEQANRREAPSEAKRFNSEYSDLSAEIRKINLQLKGFSSLPKNYQVRVRRLGVLLGDVGTPITEALHRITDTSWATTVSVSFGRLSALSIELRVTLASGQEVSPESVFSEGLQDLIAVLFFLEVAQAAALRGQARVLILDDVMQSVDSTVRLNLLDYLIERFNRWQMFITVHDQLWRGQVVQLLRARGIQFVEREIREWTSENGPSLRVATFDERGPLMAALDQGSTSLISASAGRLLEQLADTLSWTLPVSLTRRNGDRYTIGDLWPPVLKKLKTTSISGVAQEVDKWLHLRNLLGAHYNSWADSLSQSDADNFAKSILALFTAVHCDTCGQWVLSDGYRTRWSCRCGITSFSTI